MYNPVRARPASTRFSSSGRTNGRIAWFIRPERHHVREHRGTQAAKLIGVESLHFFSVCITRSRTMIAAPDKKHDQPAPNQHVRFFSTLLSTPASRPQLEAAARRLPRAAAHSCRCRGSPSVECDGNRAVAGCAEAALVNADITLQHAHLILVVRVFRRRSAARDVESEAEAVKVQVRREFQRNQPVTPSSTKRRIDPSGIPNDLHVR